MSGYEVRKSNAGPTPGREFPAAGEASLCGACPYAAGCLPGDVPVSAVARIESIVSQQRTMRAGEYLFRVGDAFSSLFAVRSGCLKSTVFDADGGEHILNFHLAGEILGFDAIYQRRHAGNAIALERATVCYLPFAEVLHVAQEFPQLVLRLLKIASRSALYTGWLTGDHHAIVRVAAFLLSITGRLKAQGRSATEFELIMSREDIANHLRLAPETVSRVLTQLRAEGAIAVKRRCVTLLDENHLHELAGPMMPYGWKQNG
jgi:CRP/FNR family transcriptional regulator